jgi:diguanylate cyclase (GGDEF)-like protein
MDTLALLAKEHGPAIEAAMAELMPELLHRQGVPLAVKDAATGRYVAASPAFFSLLGKAPEQVLGAADADWFDPAVAGALRAAEQTALSHGRPLASEHRFEWSGRRVDFTVLRTVTLSEGARLISAVWVDRSADRAREAQLRRALEQLEAQQRANEQMRRELVEVGGAQGASQGAFDEQLRRELDLSTRENREFTLALLELDAPGPAVRNAGEEGGLRVREAVMRLLRSNTRAMDSAAPVRGGRFAVLLSGVGLATAHTRMEALRRQCATQIVAHDGQELAFSVSMGVASFPHTASNGDALQAACEFALAQAQHRGGNQVALAALRLSELQP